MASMSTDVLIIGTGPAGSAMAALLSSYGVANLVVNRYRWLANTPRAHITNQRTMEVLRDLGADVEAEAYLHATPQDLMGQNVFCTSLAGEEIGRLSTWGTHPLSRAAHQLASPCHMNDLPQTFMEPLLFKTACARGTQARMSTEYIDHAQDATGVTTTLYDRLTEQTISVRSRYLIGADGGNSLVAAHAGLPFEGSMGVGGSINILFKADLSRYVAHRPSVLYWVLQPGSNVGGIGMGLVRMIRPWHEWLIVWGYDIQQCGILWACRICRWNCSRSRPGRSITSTPRACTTVGFSAWATRPIGIRPRTDWGPILLFRTPSIWRGRWRWC